MTQLSLPELVFKPENHTYWLNGVYIPGVSEVMKPLSDSMYKTIDQSVLDNAANRGSMVHEAIENYVKYRIEDCDPAYASYFNAFLDWVKEYAPEFVGSEVMIYNKIYRYAGTLDLIVKINGELWLIDVKTTAQLNHMLTSVQVVAYAEALASHGIKVDHKAILQLKKNGKFVFKPADKAEDKEAWVTFGALLTVYGHIQKYKKG